MYVYPLAFPLDKISNPMEMPDCYHEKIFKDPACKRLSLIILEYLRLRRIDDVLRLHVRLMHVNSEYFETYNVIHSHVTYAV